MLEICIYEYLKWHGSVGYWQGINLLIPNKEKASRRPDLSLKASLSPHLLSVSSHVVSYKSLGLSECASLEHEAQQAIWNA